MQRRSIAIIVLACVMALASVTLYALYGSSDRDEDRREIYALLIDFNTQCISTYNINGSDIESAVFGYSRPRPNEVLPSQETIDNLYQSDQQAPFLKPTCPDDMEMDMAYAAVSNIGFNKRGTEAIVAISDGVVCLPCAGTDDLVLLRKNFYAGKDWLISAHHPAIL